MATLTAGDAAPAFTLYDQEIRIPAWFDAPRGTLTASEEAHLRALAGESK